MPTTDQEIIKVIVAGTLLILFLGGFVIFFVVAYRKRQMKYKREKKNMEKRFQEELLRSQLEIQEQTLKNISQEIHDNIGQTLSLAKLNLNTIDLQNENAQGKILSSKEMVGKAIHDLRNLSRSLNTDSILSSGLVKAIETELSIIEHAAVFKTEFRTNGAVIRIDPKKELILFRIVQEAINNIIKHSGANRILVDIDFTAHDLKIEVTDDGSGFDSAIGSNEGQGLRNMKSRAELIGGRFSIKSGLGGTSIIVILATKA